MKKSLSRPMKGQSKPTVSTPCDVRWPSKTKNLRYEKNLRKMCQKEDRIRKILQLPIKLGKVILRKSHNKGQNEIQP